MRARNYELPDSILWVTHTCVLDVVQLNIGIFYGLLIRYYYYYLHVRESASFTPSKCRRVADDKTRKVTYQRFVSASA